MFLRINKKLAFQFFLREKFVVGTVSFDAQERIEDRALIFMTNHAIAPTFFCSIKRFIGQTNRF